ncbi:flavin reductase family protein [Mycolicibacterium sp. CBM1]
MTGESDVADVRDAFRAAMAAVCAPVAVVTALHEGSPYGTTVSAFASLSMTPPMLLVSLDVNSELLAVLRNVDRFGVNVLCSEQPELAANFATKRGTDKFSGLDWTVDAEVPRLPATSAFLACSAAQFVEGGDHVVVLGTVVAACDHQRSPLTYHQRTFGTHAVLPEFSR